MFGTRTFFSVVVVVALVCVTTVFGTIYKGEFNQTIPSIENGTLQGTVYYYYESNDLKKSKLCFEYNLKYYTGADYSVRNLYVYEDRALYSMCDVCTSQLISVSPDPWSYEAEYFDEGPNDDEYPGYKWYLRNTHVPRTVEEDGEDTFTSNMVKILLKSSTGDVKKIVFKDGSNVTFSSFIINPSDVTKDHSVFQQLATCETPTCSVRADIAFVLDNSRSLDMNGRHDWRDTMDFVRDLVNEFDFDLRKVGATIIQYSGSLLSGDWDEFSEHFPYKHVITNKKYYNPPYDCFSDRTYWCGFGRPCYQKCARFFTDPPRYCTEGEPCKYCTDEDHCQDCTGDCTKNFDIPELYKVGPNITYASFIQEMCYSKQQVLSAIASKRDNRPPYTQSHLYCKKYKKNGRDCSEWYDLEGGSTCQAFGLELAYKALFIDSPRKDKTSLSRIVIAVTDGEDKCPDRTRRAASLLRDHGVDLYEIGVGINSSSMCCVNYDTEFLQSIASVFGTEKAYFPVDGYGVINKITKKLKRPICEQLNGNKCDDLCKNSFCGCGKCFCPSTCNDNPNMCQEYICQPADDNYYRTLTDGCILSDIEELPETCSDNACLCDQCDPVQGWLPKECPEPPAGTPTCVKSQCAGGGCTLYADDDGCDAQNNPSGDECYKWKCAKDIENVGSLDHYNPVTGCYLETNLTLVEEKKLRAENKLSCYKPVCKNGVVDDIVDCPAVNDTGCFKAVCAQEGTEWTCQNVAKDKPTANDCQIAECNYVEHHWDLPDRKCAEEEAEAYIKSHPGTTMEEALIEVKNCVTFSCAPTGGGCKKNPVSPCKCDPGEWQVCEQTALASSSDTHCVKSFDCDKANADKCPSSTYKYEDCHSEEWKKWASGNNTEPGQCFTPKCTVGGCKLVSVGAPDFETNECVYAVCEKNDDGSWEWKQHERVCDSDECFARECVVGEGCKETNICTSKNKDSVCYTYSCDKEKGICKKELKGKDRYYCLEPYCKKDENNKDVLDFKAKDLNTIESCSNLLKQTTDLCTEVKCMENEKKCVPEKKTCTTKLCPDMKCFDYVCDPSTGQFKKETEKCNDFSGCTKNRCYSDGTCDFNEVVNCYEEIDMTAYTCFVAKCESNEKGDAYQCKRRLMENAYIDICGNCIAAIPEEGSSSSAGSDNTMLDCAEAPAKPLLQEGLAAASIALIILAAVVIGAGITASGIAGTKTLLNRAKGANNQSAHTNPLFEDNDAEMSNPAYVGSE